MIPFAWRADLMRSTVSATEYRLTREIIPRSSSSSIIILLVSTNAPTIHTSFTVLFLRSQRNPQGVSWRKQVSRIHYSKRRLLFAKYSGIASPLAFTISSRTSVTVFAPSAILFFSSRLCWDSHQELKVCRPLTRLEAAFQLCCVWKRNGLTQRISLSSLVSPFFSGPGHTPA